METHIAHLLNQYETGTMTRRQLVAGLGSLVALLGGSGYARSAEIEPARAGSTFEATEVNHIALRTTDVGRSRDFYVKHLGLSVSREGANNAFLTCGNNFLALFRGDTPGMDHYCYSVKDFDVADAEDKLRAVGMPDIRRTGERIYFSDPDNLTVQLAEEGHGPT